MALAGAATVRVPQRVGYASVKGGILSPDGHCRAFDADAQGTIFGSGVGAVLLKDLAAALADGNHIYAVIKGSAINNDGADKVSYTASSAAGQARAMIEALLMADVSPDDIAYVECHGTGTVVGDPLEIEALTRAFRTRTDRRGFCAIGSVKSNIGHLEQTAGLAALIKTAMALKHGKIPPSLNFRNPNPKIDFAASPFFVNTQCRDWPAGDHPRRAAVNSLGLGGTNAFVVLEQPPTATAVVHEAGPSLFALSARTPAALAASVERHLTWLAREQPQLPDVCFTGTSGRTHFPVRFAAVVDSKEQLREALLARAGSGRGASIRRGAPAGFSVLRTGVAIRANGRRALSSSAGVPGGSRPLRRDRRRPFGTAAQRRAPRRRCGFNSDRRNRLYAAGAVRGPGRPHCAVAVLGHRSHCGLGAQRGRVCGCLQRRRLHAGASPGPGRRTCAPHARFAAGWRHGCHFREPRNRGSGDPAI